MDLLSSEDNHVNNATPCQGAQMDSSAANLHGNVLAFISNCITTTSSTNAEDNGKGSEEDTPPVLDQESASNINTTERRKRSSSCCKNKTKEMRETTALGDSRVDAPYKTTDKTNKIA
eukprot:13308683-Ditylum_brightwellii.AAC.1